MVFSLFSFIIPSIIFPYIFSLREAYRAFKTKKASATDLVELLKIPKISDKEIKNVIIKYSEDKKDIFFVQIGSNDGKTGDPIYEIVSISSKWKGILVEPIPLLYERLIKNYSMRSGLIFEQSVISDKAKTVDFYVVNPAAQEVFDLPWYYDQISSLSQEHIIKHFGEKITPYIKKEKLQALSFNDLLAKHDYESQKIDFLHIDVEGYDYQVARQISLKQCLPQMLLIEFRHLKYHDCLKLIKKFSPNYHMYSNNSDLFFVLK